MDKIKINFVSQGNFHLASHRMRVALPTELLNVSSEVVEVIINPKALEGVSVNVFNKHFDAIGNITSAQSGKQKGFYSVFDICDDHFDRAHGDYYKKMCEISDYITCNSRNMQTRIKEVTGKNARVIPDPITFPIDKPLTFSGMEKRIKKIGDPQLLWYGHSSNAGALKPWLDHLHNVTVICDAAIAHPKVTFEGWRPGLVERSAKHFDIVLVPSTTHPWSKCKSPNRVVDALAAGKFIITDNKEIYREFLDFVYFIDSPKDLTKAIKFWKENPRKVSQMVSKGQKYVLKNFKNEVILDSWLNVFKDLGLIEEFKNVEAKISQA